MLAPRLVRRALLCTCLILAAAPAGALADTSTSTNWSGYAAHGGGVKFRRVGATWIQPAATCRRGQNTYSSFWVGLGGYSTTANGLEQIGTELDCTTTGQQRSSVWYELVPAPSRPINMTVKTGDRMSASVTVVGEHVTMRLVDHTRGKSFLKKLTTHSIDVTSADWIAEAPSTCNAAGFCRALPLADFGTARFTAASAQTTAGRTGTIAYPAWTHTRIVLTQGGSPFTGVDTQRTSTPSALQNRGRAFAVHYGQSSGLKLNARSAATASSAGVVQPGGVRQ